MIDSSLTVIAPVLEVYYRPNPEPTLLDHLDVLRDQCLSVDCIYTNRATAEAIYAKGWPLKNEIVSVEDATDYPQLLMLLQSMQFLLGRRGPHHALFLPSHYPITKFSFQFVYHTCNRLYREMIKTNYKRPVCSVIDFATETWRLQTRIYESQNNQKYAEFTTYAPDIL